MIYSELSGISDTEYDPSSKPDLSFHVVADILNLLFLYGNFYIFPCVVEAKS